MASGAVQQLTDDNFEAEVLRCDRPTLVDFWAAWCGPCRALTPVVEALGRRYRDRVKIGILDVDRHQRTAARYGIRAVPALLVFSRGQVVAQLVGAGPGTRSKLEAALEKALAGAQQSAAVVSDPSPR